MESTLAETVRREKVDQGSLAIFWLSQAGFVFKGSSSRIVYIDPYFSDVVEHKFGFKRMMPCPISPEEVEADLIICTHEHLDHMDSDALPVVARNPRVRFAGPIECIREFAKMGIPETRCTLLEEAREVKINGITIHTTYADHGALAPDAVGVVVDLDGIRIYHTGDTCYRPKEFQPAIEMDPQILLPCINGQFGNMNSEEAALLTSKVKPKLVIASHFWMFVEHGGDPASFLVNCRKLAPDVCAIVMKPGERIIFHEQ